MDTRIHKTCGLLAALVFIGCGDGLFVPEVCEEDCPPLPAGTGAIQIVVNATDIDGLPYDGNIGPAVGALDRQLSGELDPNDELLIPSVARGTHTIELRDLAAHCRVLGPNPRFITVFDDATTNVVFEVECEELKPV